MDRKTHGEEKRVTNELDYGSNRGRAPKRGRRKNLRLRYFVEKKEIRIFDHYKGYHQDFLFYLSRSRIIVLFMSILYLLAQIHRYPYVISLGKLINGWPEEP